ncbi:MAG TPA: glycoside hydrolase family 20 zincin-like fold domain-containing protein [Pyrinomonadaceae bacterium]|nr:glycoside hydrolase family 20 zincin-like fold domain-containing protein [Pyrinomonadaceae bacterium]
MSETPQTKREARRAALLLLLACLSVHAFASDARARQAQVPATVKNPIQVIPAPKSVSATGADFSLSRGARVVVADAKSEDDRFAAQEFADDLQETAGVALKVGGGGRRQILVGPLSNRRVLEAVGRAGVAVPAELNEEGYVLAVTGEFVVVGGRSAAGTFYGLQTLKQLVRGEGEGAYVQGARVVDWPSVRWRGLSDDISRGPVPTMQYLKRQIRTLAMFKMNMHSLYMEHVFGSASHPLIAPEGGAVTPAEIRELVAYARRHHVELVPQQQTFGHLHKALKFERYNELAEVPYGDVLSPQQEGTYKLVADWYRELDELFPSQFFHIGADETFELGRGQSAEAVKARGIGPVYFDHLKRVRELLLPYKRRLMFWGDIALNHPELLPGVPRDMIAMNWDYSARQNFEARIGLFKKAGLEQFVCPGVQSWNQIFPNTDTAAVNIVNFVRDGQRAGVLGVMNTQWDDDGESLFENSWYGVVLGAAASWQVAPLDLAAFERDFDWAFFRHEGDDLIKATRTLGAVNTKLGINNSDQLFWRDPFTDNFQESIARKLEEQTRQMRLDVEEVQETLIRERPRVRRNVQTLDSMRLAARRFDHLGRRAQVVEQLSRDYWEAYLNLGDRQRVRRLRPYAGTIYNSLREMSEELTELREAYRAQWLAENRPYWLASVLARYDLAVSRWLSRSKQLEEALRLYDQTSTLPAPAEFGLGPRPPQED